MRRTQDAGHRTQDTRRTQHQLVVVVRAALTSRQGMLRSLSSPTSDPIYHQKHIIIHTTQHSQHHGIQYHQRHTINLHHHFHNLFYHDHKHIVMIIISEVQTTYHTSPICPSTFNALFFLAFLTLTSEEEMRDK